MFTRFAVLGLVLASSIVVAQPNPVKFLSPEVLLHEPGLHRTYPVFADVQGTGKADLYLGMASWNRQPGGPLQIYRNTGSNAQPTFAKPTFLHDVLPSARIPDG